MIGIPAAKLRRALALVLLPLAAACATIQPTPNSRQGLFARLHERGHGHDSEQQREPADTAPVFPKRGQAPALAWPLKETQVTSPFGPRGSEFHEGVDLRAKLGTTVYAAQTGVVIYADRKIRGYGKMVVIRHAPGWSTVYAHNSRILVHAGQKVQQGQAIAVSGNTGHSHGPHLHFEVRKDIAAIDPLRLLPHSSRRTAFRMRRKPGPRLAAQN